MTKERRVGRRYHTMTTPLTHRSPVDADHPAVIEGRTRFPAKVMTPTPADIVLKPSGYVRKIGDRSIKDEHVGWRAMPMFHVTLEERATCSTDCPTYVSCYGNDMRNADRWVVGPEFYDRVRIELELHSLRYWRGFRVRLHELGDFASVEYVNFWIEMVDLYPALHVWGSTGHPRSSPIGAYLEELSRTRWERFAIRFSGGRGERSSTVIDHVTRGRIPEGIVCPAQTEKDRCCGSCGLCWGTRDPIVFIQHYK